jgi:hypothetical protein
MTKRKPMTKRKLISSALATAFQIEDKPILEAVQSNTVTDFWSEKPVSLKTDAGGVLARRLLEKLIASEAG